MPFFKKRFGARTVTGSRVGEVQRIFRDIYNLGGDFPVDGRQFDLLLNEGQVLEVGSFRVRAMHTPGHTPAHMSWQIEDALFVGDTLFMPDYGTARCDFPGGSAEQLFDSIQRIYALPTSTRLFMCHDYQPGGRPLRFVTTVAEQKRSNIQLNERITREEYLTFRKTRDAQLEMPALILPAVQINIRAGELPDPEANGTSYLKIPVNAF
jgi:glyoxylase-like metal-dependent hydrolase (beta-lactamase superfamily II)